MSTLPNRVFEIWHILFIFLRVHFTVDTNLVLQLLIASRKVNLANFKVSFLVVATVYTLAVQLTVQIESTASLKEAAYFSEAIVSNYRCVKYLFSNRMAIVFLLHGTLHKLVSMCGLGLRVYV